MLLFYRYRFSLFYNCTPACKIDLNKELVLIIDHPAKRDEFEVEQDNVRNQKAKLKKEILCSHDDEIEMHETKIIKNVNELNARNTSSDPTTQMMILVPSSSSSSSLSSLSSPISSSSSLQSSPQSPLERDIHNKIHGRKEQKVNKTILTQNNKTRARAIIQNSDGVNALEFRRRRIFNQQSEFYKNTKSDNNKSKNCYKNLLLMSNANLETESTRENNSPSSSNNIEYNSTNCDYEQKFPSVGKLVQMYTTMIDKKNILIDPLSNVDTSSIQRLSENESDESIKLKLTTNRLFLDLSNHRSPVIIDEGCSTTPRSTYYSSDEEIINETDGTLKIQERVMRSSSSDSALGLDDDCGKISPTIEIEKKRRNTLTVTDIPLRPALLPLAEPTTLPTRDSPTSDIHLAKLIESNLCPVKSTMLLEAQIIKIPALPDTDHVSSPNQQKNVRRESSQSIISDCGDDSRRVRYMRTPSVVVSDYSDEMMCGITLEEIEYFKEQQSRRLSYDDLSDLSASSSCSNLNYCGSQIGSFDGMADVIGLQPPQRKISSCSTCSTLSCDDTDYASDFQPEAERPPQKKKVSDVM